MADAPDASPAPETPPPDVSIGGYRPLSQITHTAHGALYRAQKGEAAPVLLKAVKQGKSSEAMLERFEAVVQSVSKISHANVCKLTDRGTDEATGLKYFAFETAGTETLKDLVGKRGKLRESEAAAVAAQIANALDCIYGQKLIHGDIKPSHIVVARGGVTQLAGLGVAEPMADATTGSGESAHFMSPEVAGAGDADIRADMYSLGAVIYYMLAGEVPFADKTPKEAVAAQRTGTVTWPGDVAQETSSGLMRVAARMMAKDPGERYRTPTELVLDLHIVKEGQQPVIASSAPSQSTLVAPKAKSAGRPAVRRPTGSVSKSKLGRSVGRATKQNRAVREAPRRSGPNLKLVAAGMGGLVVLLVGMALILGGGDDKTKLGNMPMPATMAMPAPPPVRTPASDPVASAPSAPQLNAGNAHQEFDDAKAFATANPDDYEGILKRLVKCRAFAGTSPLGELIDAEIGSVTTRRLEAAHAALDKALARSRALAGSSNYDGAVQALDDVPEHVRKLMDARLVSEIARVKKEGDDRIRAVFAKAGAHLDGGNTAGARIELSGLDSIKHTSGRKVLAKNEQALYERMRDVERQKREVLSVGAQKELPALLEKFDAFIDKGQYGNAYDLMESAMARAELVPVVRTLGAAKSVSAALMERNEAMREAAEESVGKAASFRTRKGVRRGTVLGADGGGIEVEIVMMLNGKEAGRTKTTILWGDLVQAEQAALLKNWEPDDERSEAVGLAMVAVARHDEARARKELARAGNHELADHVRTRVDALKFGAEDAKASALWRRIAVELARDKPSPRQTKRLGKLLDEFESRYGKSRFAVALGEKLPAARDRLAKFDKGRQRAMRIAADAVTYEGNRYRVFTEKMAWEQARLACRRLGGHLVSITSAGENEFVRSLAAKAGTQVWVGLTDQHARGCWAWDDGEPYVFGQWERTQPGGRQERAVFLYTNGRWHDIRADDPNAYVCEWRTRGKPEMHQPRGLLGTYYKDRDLKQPLMRRLDAELYFLWARERPDLELPVGRPWSAVWVGSIVPEVTAEYVIDVNADDHHRVELAGEVVLQNWTGRPKAESTTPLKLVAGTAYPVRIEYRDAGGGASFRLMWRVSDVGRAKAVPIPPQCFHPPNDYATQPGPPIRQPVLQLPDAE